MNVYQNAVDALKECVKQSMESDVPSNTQGEIWRHYQGMKTIANDLLTAPVPAAPEEPSSAIFGQALGREFYDPDYNVYAAAAADTISLDGGAGSDVITFS